VSAAERIGTFPPRSPDWHAARASGIGASEIAAVLGLSPWESRFSLWHRKAGTMPPVEETVVMRLGTVLEAPLAELFAAQHPELRIKRTGTWRSRLRSWQLCNPDRLASDRGGPTGRSFFGSVPVEIKWAPYSDGWGPAGSDEIPVHYRCQVLWQLDVLGAPFGYLAALVGADYREYYVEYDPEDCALLRDAGAAFVASLPQGDFPGEPPNIDESGHTFRALKRIHPDIEDREVELTHGTAAMYREALEGARVAASLEQYAKNVVLDSMGTARRAVFYGERVAMRVPGPHGIQLRETKPPKPTGQKVRSAL
jgi:putative phage-type endonuclease